MGCCIKLAPGEKDGIIEKSYLTVSIHSPALYLQGRHGIVQMAHLSIHLSLSSTSWDTKHPSSKTH